MIKILLFSLAFTLSALLTPFPLQAQQKACIPGGCSGQLCVEEGSDAVTTCEWKPEYACYQQHGECTRQTSGQCGWTPSTQLQTCIDTAQIRQPTPISWSNNRFTLTADDFYIQINDQKFFANDENVEIVSDPGHANYFTIELRSSPGMNMYVYRFAGGTKWYIGEIRTGANNLQTDWLYYPAQEVLDYPNPLQKSELSLTSTSPNGNITGTIYFKNLKLTPKFSAEIRDTCPSPTNQNIKDVFSFPNPIHGIWDLERNKVYDNINLVNGSATVIQNNYATYFSANAVAGEKLEFLAEEKDVNILGSYVETLIFGPDGEPVADKYGNYEMDTRFAFVAPKTGRYFFVVRTRECKEGRIKVSLTSLDDTEIFPMIKTPTGEKFDLFYDVQIINAYNRIGKQPAQYILQVPRAISVVNKVMNYEVLTQSGWQPRSAIMHWYERPQPINKYGLEWWTFFHDGNYLPTSVPTTSVQVTKLSDREFLISRIGSPLAQPYAQTPDGYFPEQHQYVQALEITGPNQNTWNFESRFSTVNARFETGESSCQADITQDGIVDISDFGVMKEHFFTNTRLETCDSKYPTGVTAMCRADVDKSGMIEISDYSILVKHFFSQTDSCW